MTSDNVQNIAALIKARLNDGRRWGSTARNAVNVVRGAV